MVLNMDDRTQQVKQIKWEQVVSILLKEIGRSAESRSDISAVFGLPLPVHDIQMTVPGRLGRTVITPDLAKQVTANVGFAHQLVNFHIDTGYGRLAALVGGCQKIWLFAPPTVENLALLQGEERTPAYLVTHLSKLAVIRQTSADVMFLPPGMIHATFTEKTGILYGNHFRTRENIFGATLGLVHTMVESAEEPSWSERDRIIPSWIDTMRNIKEHGDQEHIKEALFAFRLSEMHRLRREGAFQHWTGELEKLARECYRRARLRSGVTREDT